MAQKDDEARLATHRERAAKVEARIQHREKMKGDALYRKLSRARTSLESAWSAMPQQSSPEEASIMSVVDILDRRMSALRAPKPTEGGT